MRRFAIACLTIAAVAAGSSAAADPPRAQLTNFGCQTALDPPARAVQVTAVMRPIAGTHKLQLKFDLLRRLKGSKHYRMVRAGDLAKWRSPPHAGGQLPLGQLPGDVWNDDKQVANLVAPAIYRFRVHFRWIGMHGHVLGTVVLVSPVCYQPEDRPDLLVQSLRVVPPATPGPDDEYVAVIRNRGASGTGPFDVQLSSGSQSRTATIQWLPAHSRHRLTFTAPACTSGSYVNVIVDPAQQVDEYDRGNDQLEVPCP